MILAVTGGTGFVGARFLDIASRAGIAVKALTRRPQPRRDGVQWIEGSLSDADALRNLVTGCSAAVHIAGVLKARDAAGFEQGNVEGTLAMLAAATAAGITRFVHVSSLAAREPELSRYGGSKARAETLVERSGIDWVIVRPPAVYGPGDRETLELFKMARMRLMLLPPGGRVSLVHVDDLCRLLLALAKADRPSGVVLEPDDGRPDGWTHKDVAEAIGRAVGRNNVALSLPASMLRLGAVVDQLVRRERAKLSTDRAAYFSHSDWVVSSGRKPAPDLWSPRIDTEQGLADTARWYKANGWL
ncbi:NAD-dependent epimerase/dehydratase family protein [Sphingomonas sabuli]|uniref:NAD-dependent epimerase/dehydratase family protein n=1 Tax=Sphingomonas sabuli TaxID=2764186 RepID=UPI001FE3243A|nr:NAD(P)H-binding protein [Sphingomonas sabuli]